MFVFLVVMTRAVTEFETLVGLAVAIDYFELVVLTLLSTRLLLHLLHLLSPNHVLLFHYL